MLEFEVIPEYGLSSSQIEILLGMHLSHAVASIQSLVGIIKAVQILYSDSDPLGVDLVIKMTNDGIKLSFDPIHQRLRVIQVYDLSLLRLKYGDHLFNCPEVIPTIETIDQSFGATHPGVYDEEQHVFRLSFRGLSFEFPAKTSISSFSPTSLPRRSLTVSSLAIYGGSVFKDSLPPPPPPPRFPTSTQGGTEVLRVGTRSSGIRLRIHSSPSGRSSDLVDILFGSSVQDVLSALGAPGRIFFKAEDKMKIHSPNGHRKAASRKSDYFFNYFTLGFDILLDARRNTVKKFVMHTNFPGHYNFNIYHRCLFELPIYSELHSSSSSLRSSSEYSEPRKLLSISTFSTWSEISEALQPFERPVILNRSSSTNTTNPFGSTFCYGYQDVIFEVMPNGQLASLTIFDESRKDSRSLELLASRLSKQLESSESGYGNGINTLGGGRHSLI